MKYAAIGALIGGVMVWFFSGTVVNSNKIGLMNFNSSSQGQVKVMGNIDQHFIEQMIPHHEDAITMSKLAQTRAQGSEVKQLANSIIESQGKEITLMKDWYKNWFGQDVPADNQVMNQHGMMGSNSSMHMGMMGDASDLTRLEQATEFDKTFIEEMIPHHQMAIMMASMLQNSTQRPEMKKLATDIIDAQTKEINQMRQWLKN